jgi:SAM-dependent methyltransferase
MEEIWESCFVEAQTSWGFEPSDSAILVKDLFLKQQIHNILIPGIGYGRNATIFVNNGMNVSGIEISKTAIELARTKNRLDIPIHHGSVTNMPFNQQRYDGIFCYALVHLLNYWERRKFIKACYEQLKPNGYMVFTVISKTTSMYGQGKKLSKDRYQIMNGLNVFFYDAHSVKKEFGSYGLIEYNDIDEPIKHMKGEPPLKCILIKCQRDI